MIFFISFHGFSWFLVNVVFFRTYWLVWALLFQVKYGCLLTNRFSFFTNTDNIKSSGTKSKKLMRYCMLKTNYYLQSISWRGEIPSAHQNALFVFICSCVILWLTPHLSYKSCLLEPLQNLQCKSMLVFVFFVMTTVSVTHNPNFAKKKRDWLQAPCRWMLFFGRFCVCVCKQ